MEEEESILKPQQGKNLPIRLPKTADSEEVLKLPVEKQYLHNGNEIVHSSVHLFCNYQREPGRDSFPGFSASNMAIVSPCD